MDTVQRSIPVDGRRPPVARGRWRPAAAEEGAAEVAMPCRVLESEMRLDAPPVGPANPGNDPDPKNTPDPHRRQLAPAECAGQPSFEAPPGSARAQGRIDSEAILEAFRRRHGLPALCALLALTAAPGAPAAARTTSASAQADVAAPSGAAPADSAPPVEALVGEALRRSPAIAALRAQVAAAREMESPASALPDPMVEAMVIDAGFPRNSIGEEEMSMAGVEVRQGLLYRGKRGAAGAAAHARTVQRRSELEAFERQVAAEIRRLYARLYSLDREAEALAAARELVDMLSATAAARYAAGESEQEAVIKSQIETERLGEKLDDLRAERSAVTAEFNRWLDRPGDAPLGSVRALPPVASPPRPWEEAVVARSPEVAVGKAAVALAEREVEVAELELKPNLSTAAGVGFRGGLDPVVTLRFGVELPFWRRVKQLPMLRAAEQGREMARQELRDRESMARAEAARLEAEWARSERQIARYREAIVPQTTVALDAARSSYLAGQGDFSTVIEDFNLWLEARVELARREAERFTVWADLERLTGSAGAAAAQGAMP